jgi:hypothetical protein
LPLTTVELNEQYHAAAGDFQAGRDVVAALSIGSQPNVNELGKALPIVGTAAPEKTIPGLEQDWDELAAVEKYLQTHEKFFALIETHAAKRTNVRYATNLTPGFYTPLNHIQQLRHGARVLTLQFHVDLRHQHIDQAIQRLDQTVFLAETLRDEPFLVAQLVRIAIIGVALGNLDYLLKNVTLTDAQLAQLQQTFRQVDMRQGFATGMKGELATGYTATTWPLSHLATDGSAKPMSDDEVTRLAKRGPNRPGDAALMLKFYGRLLAANDESLAAAADEALTINDEIKQLAGSHRKIFYMHTVMLFPAVQASTKAFLRVDARCKSADAALAALRYRQAQGTWPMGLADLAPAYLPVSPRRPHRSLHRQTAPLQNDRARSPRLRRRRKQNRQRRHVDR